MKTSTRLAAAFCATFLSCAGLLPAQTLNITANGYSGTKLFDSTPGYTITGMGASALGDLFYIETDSNFTTPGNSVLYRRSAADGYAQATPLFNLGAGIYGSFVIVADNKVIFADGFTIRSVDLNGGSPDVLGTVPNNYDAAYFGGQLYVSNNIEPGFSNPPKNRVTRYDFGLDSSGDGGLALTNGTHIIKADNDYSGPLEFAGGDLFYGASGAYANGDETVRGLYRFPAGTFGTSELTLDNPYLFANTTRNTALAFGGGSDLWQDTFTGTLSLYDLTDGSALVVGNSQESTGIGSLGQLDFQANTLFVAVTGSFYDRSAIYAVVPEPGSAALLALAGCFIAARRRR